ncbi:hypothetical protein COHA_003450 [Chlorella ohadii]|uniref:Uncharacterized protein n=1 Tax=Chlorella ohadii TaxID=2649997 RepID=A0AAD5DVB9_9CHLO|nr:hypothetical protein COHA_003450 [Chlorella ohadii]
MLRNLQPLAARITRSNGKQLLQRRGMAADAHGEVKLNAWEAPTEIAKWKEEHIVFLVLGGWGVGIWGAMKMFATEKKESAPVEAPPKK